MSAAVLSTQLQAIADGVSESAAIDAWVEAWFEYFKTCDQDIGSGIEYNVFQDHPEIHANMAAAMTGLSVSGQAAAKIQAGIIAWWDTIDADPGNYLHPSTGAITPPPGLTDIASDLSSIFAANTSGALSKSAACDAIADSLHANNYSGFLL